MKLTELSPRFIRYESKVEIWDVIVGPPETWRERGCPTSPFTGPREYQPEVATLEEAQGLLFQCPLCKSTNGHHVNVTFADRGVPDELGSHDNRGKPSRWAVSGSSFEDLTTRPSIHLSGPGCGWHGYITNGEAA